MGGAVIESDEPIICGGDDVLGQLNRVFEDPTSSEYKHAKNNNTFGDIKNTKDNYKDLIAAYVKAGFSISPGWHRYLRRLGTVDKDGPQQGPQNIYDIAQARYIALTNDVGMSTVIHTPQHGGHVHTKHGSGAQASMIDSPCPLPQP
jgi:hypothetical protein